MMLLPSGNVVRSNFVLAFTKVSDNQPGIITKELEFPYYISMVLEDSPAGLKLNYRTKEEADKDYKFSIDKFLEITN